MKGQPITWVFESIGSVPFTPEQKQRYKDHLRRKVRKELSAALSSSGSVTIQRRPSLMEVVIVCDSLGDEIARFFRYHGYKAFQRVKKPV